MPIQLIYGKEHYSGLSLNNSKVTLTLAETRNEGKVVVRLVFSVSSETNGLTLTAFVPFESVGKPVLRQNSLLDRTRNEKIGLSMVFGRIRYDFREIIGRKLVLTDSQGRTKEVNIPEEDEIEITQVFFKMYPPSLPKSSLVTVKFKNPMKPGTYGFKFSFCIKNVTEDFFEHWIFEKGDLIEVPVFAMNELRDEIVKETNVKSDWIIDPQNIEFFLLTPSNVVTSRPKPEEYDYRQFEKEEEVTLGGILGQETETKHIGYDYEPHRGRHQFRWFFRNGGGIISFRFLTPSITPIFIFYSVLLFDLVFTLYIFRDLGVYPKFSRPVLFLWILLLNCLAYAFIRRPSVLAELARTMAKIGYSNISLQVLGCTLLTSLECFIVIIGLEKVFKSPQSQIVIGLFALLYVVLIGSISENLPSIVRRKFLKLNPSKWEIIECVAFSWNLFLYSAAVTVAAFGTDLLLKFNPEIFFGRKSEIAVFFCLIGGGAFGGKILELYKGKVEL